MFLSAICMFVGKATAARLLASHYSGTLYVLELSDDNALSVTSEIPSGSQLPAWITLDSQAKTAYIADESWYGLGTLSSFSVDQDDSSLTATASVQTKGGELHSCLYGGDDGEGFIALANYEGSYITTYQLPLMSDGQQPLQTVEFTMDGTGPIPDRQNKPHPHSVIADPSGSALFVPDLGADLIRIFAIDASTGKLSECPSAATGAGDGPRHGEFVARLEDGAVFLYTVNELGNSVTAWNVSYDDECPVLSSINTLSTFPDSQAAPNGSKAAEVHVRDTSLYASNRFDRSFGDEEDSLAVFEIATNGSLTLRGLVNAHAYFPRTFVTNKAGDLVAVAGQTSANVAILERNMATGELGALVASVDVGAEGTVNQEDGLSAVVWLE